MPATRPTARRVLAALVTATVATGTAALTAPAVAHADPAGCAATYNLFIPGTWETNENADPSVPVGMLKPIADAITSAQGDRAEVYTLPYMARAFDNGHTYADSKSDARAKADNVLSEEASRCARTKFTITGYSQGADAAGDLASAIGNGNGPIPPERVLAVGLLADPGAGTKGAAVVGPRSTGTGIADPRPQGMGKLSGRVASICYSGKDLYCSIQKGSNPLLGSLGSILSKSPSTGADTAAGGNSTLATALTSDFSKADLPGISANTTSLAQQSSANTIDVAQVAKSATSLMNTLTPVADLIASGAANSAATTQLTTAAPGTAEHAAGQVLGVASRTDLSSALTTAAKLADTASSLMQSGTTTLPSASPDATALSTAAGTLSTQVAPLAATPADALSSASSVLSVLKPSVVVGQALNVVTNVTALDLPGILRNLTVLPQKVAALDARGAHQIAGELNNQVSPLVRLAAGVDLRWVSQILSVIPDPTGYTQIAALVTSILGNVDIVRLANLVGQIQEIAWAAVEKLLPPPGQVPDPLGAGAAMTGLLPVGLDLASVAVNMLSGKATKTDVALLGKQTNTASHAITTQAQNVDLPGLTGSLTTMASSQGADDLAALVGEGLNAASFFTSGAHTDYGNLVVDNAGRSAIKWLSDWLNLQIGRAA
ncbi:cutinase family protein [Rhodococcus koreensis]|uniref:Cutinase n=1 Tax=Rhodococcus koreensis TaxID=99653 RepID=A0A1H5EMF0_9NOCA|nr:cutinase family protein [Rhodococcus koreensis]SED92164.1 Cutinase [Rhodococcus koreensis]